MGEAFIEEIRRIYTQDNHRTFIEHPVHYISSMLRMLLVRNRRFACCSNVCMRMGGCPDAAMIC